MGTKNTYWNERGQYSHEAKVLQDYLYPKDVFQECETLEGRLLSAVSYFYYDEFNNGSCNVYEVKTDCEGEYSIGREWEYPNLKHSRTMDKWTYSPTWRNVDTKDEKWDKGHPELAKVWEEYVDEMIENPTGGYHFDGHDEDKIQEILERLVTSAIEVVMLKYKVVGNKVVEEKCLTK